MARRFVPFAMLLLAAACSSGSEEIPAVAKGSEHISCAVDGVRELADVCAVERVEKDGKLELVVRHPEGGFRRFEVVSDGRGVAVADGADEAVVKLQGNTLDVRVGEDRYRFPATQKINAIKP